MLKWLSCLGLSLSAFSNPDYDTPFDGTRTRELYPIVECYTSHLLSLVGPWYKVGFAAGSNFVTIISDNGVGGGSSSGGGGSSFNGGCSGSCCFCL